MSNKYLSIVVLVVTVLLAFLLFSTSSCGEKKIVWDETYREEKGAMKARPYNLDLLRICLNGADFKTHEMETSISKTLKSDLKNSTYFFVGEAIRADSSDWKALTDFVKNGNDAFISSKYVANKFLKYFLKENKTKKVKHKIEKRELEEQEDSETIYDENEDVVVVESPPPPPEDEYFEDEIAFDNQMREYSDSVVNISLISPSQYSYQTGISVYYSTNKEPIKWLFFDEDMYSSDFFAYPIQKIGTLNNLGNCLCINYGEGKIFLHSNPILFSNVELTRISVKDYSMKLFSLLKKGDIYWDSKNRTNVSTAMYNDMDRNTQAQNPNDASKKGEKTPLQYILGNEQLSWAWYSMLVMGVVFLFFSTKRRQRIIPVLAKNTNTSLAFIQTIGRIYFNTQDHSSLSRMQYKQWQWFVRNRYGLVTNNMNEDFEKRLAQKSGLIQKDINFLIESGKYIDQHHTGESNLTEFYKTLSAFYDKCK